MNNRIRLRLLGLAAGIGLMGLVIAFLGAKERREMEALHVRLNQVNDESFQIAEDFADYLRKLNESLYHYGRQHTAPNPAAFTQASHDLDVWIDSQKLKLTSEQEKGAMEKIDSAYNAYMLAANNLLKRLEALGEASATIDEYTELTNESQNLFKLVESLRNAHLERRTDVIAQASLAIQQAWTLQLVSLGILFALAGALAVVVYRQMIAPLRARLVEGEALLERQEKLASLGMLAAGVAHEIRNPLTAIKGALFLQEKKLEPGSKEYADGKVIEREILRLERIVNDFLFFSRPRDLELAPTTADVPLRAVHDLLAPQLAKNNIQLVLEEPSPLPITIDEAQIEQVLINMVQNASEAIGKHGVVTLRARSDRKRLRKEEKKVILLEVADTGKGIAAEVQQRLFDPFFTTKEGGTGLGLSIAAGIVEKHGGAIEYQTQVDRGTIFGIVLPASGA